MPINAHPEYLHAEKEFHAAQTDEQKLLALEKMTKFMPKHKSAEALRKNIRTRYKKLKKSLEQKRKAKKSGKKLGIKKEEMQAVLVGLTNSGKSSVLKILTNANPEIASYDYTTKQPNIGTLDYENAKIQIIDMPAIENEICDLSTINTADTLLMVISKVQDIEKISAFLKNAPLNRIIIFNKSDLLSEQEKRKISAFLQSKKYNFIIFSCRTAENLPELKEKIFQSFGKIRVYTKEPGKQADNRPFIMPEGSSVKDVAEKILHGFSERIIEARVTGPSSKFPNQKASPEHILKDRDIVEFHAR